MTTTWSHRFAVAGVAAVGVYVATIGLPVPTGCVAGAEPSPTCGGDLRECLRLKADIRQTTFGGRYVTAEDVATCMEAFNACIHGGASTGATGVPPTPTGGEGRKGLPSRFAIKGQFGTYDCTRNGDALRCTVTGENLPPGEDSLTLAVTGTLSGLTMTGTATGHQTGHAPANPSCTYAQDLSGPAKYVFSLDGTVAMQEGPFQINATTSGSCPGSSSFSSEVGNQTATWSAIQ